MQSKRERNNREDETEVPSASTSPMASAKFSGSDIANGNAAHIAQSTEHGKEAVTVSTWVVVLLDWTD